MAREKENLLLSLVLLFIIEGASHAKEWRGITPLHSKREDVVRLFRQCADSKIDCVFELSNDRINIMFAGDLVGDFKDCSAPPDTVLLIEVNHKSGLQFNGLGLDPKSRRAFDPSTPPNMGYVAYIDENEGLLLNTYNGNVLTSYYIAAARDRHLCPSYYEDPESIVQVGLSDSLTSVIAQCPATKPRAGERITISADAAVDRHTRYVWTLSAGKIIKGQGTKVITVDTRRLKGQTITATVDVGSGAASCVVQISPRK
jgi:hypothetical protein